MNLFNELENEITSIKQNFNDNKKHDIKYAVKIIKNENKDISLNIKALYNDNLNSPDELIARIIVTFNLAINKTYEITDKLLENSIKIIIHLCKNNEVASIDIKELEQLYSSTIKDIDNLNEKFIKTMYHNYDLFLKNKDNKLVLLIKDGELKLISNLSNILLDKKDKIKKLFKYNIIPFVKYIKESKEEEKLNTKKKITNYFIDLYEEYIDNLTYEYKILIDDYIKDRLDILDNKVKSINKKSKISDLMKLKNYLLSFNKELFNKNKNILLEMSKVLKAEDKEKEFKTTTKMLDKIYNISYKFDKVYDEYRENMQSILVNNKGFDEINKLVKDEEEEIERYFSNKIMSLFKETEEYLHSLIYKLMLSYGNIK